MTAFLLSLRKGLEAALIVGILSGALRRFGRVELSRFIWARVAMTAIVRAGVAPGPGAAGMELKRRNEEIFAGVTLLLAAGFLTGMIFWVPRQSAAWRAALTANVRRAIADANGWALFAVAFPAVVRKGIELALLLVAIALQGSVAATGLGVMLGLTAALTYVAYRAGIGWFLWRRQTPGPVAGANA